MVSARGVPMDAPTSKASDRSPAGGELLSQAPNPTAAKPVQVWKPGRETPQLLSAGERIIITVSSAPSSLTSQ